jgi:hypothetical protein
MEEEEEDRLFMKGLYQEGKGNVWRWFLASVRKM